MVHGGLRRKTRISPTSPAMEGTTWYPLAPLPITPARLPRRSAAWSQRALWKLAPAKSARSVDGGMLGVFSWPTALITALNRVVSLSA